MIWMGSGWPKWRIDSVGRVHVLELDGSPDVIGVLPDDEADRMRARVVDRWGELILRAARETGCPAEHIGATMWAESGGNPRAVSPAGAVGLMQLMPAFFGGNEGGRLLDPWTNIRSGAGFLAELRAAGNDTIEASSCYNCGPKGDPPRPKPSTSKPFGLCHDPPYLAHVLVSSNTWIARGWPRTSPSASTSSSGGPVIIAAAIAWLLWR